MRPLRQSNMNHPAERYGPEHAPVLLTESLELLRCSPGGVYIDLTVGMGGHAQAIAEHISPGGKLIGIDRDAESLQKASLRLSHFGETVRLFHENFKNLPLIINNLGLQPVDGILADLGVSSYQLLSPERGFSFQTDAMLDMRLDRSQPTTASHLVNELSEAQLADVIYKYGEERLSRRIAAAIVRAREQAPITRCSQLAEIVSRTIKARGHRNIHPATRTFQALRIAVNQELEGLEDFLTEAFSFLKPGGRILVIAFHSLEDRAVKTAFRRLSGHCVCGRPTELCTCPRSVRAEVITPRPLTPKPAETRMNPRARSARLRCVERI